MAQLIEHQPANPTIRVPTLFGANWYKLYSWTKPEFTASTHTNTFKNTLWTFQVVQTLEQTHSCASSQKDEHELSDSPKTGRKFLSKADVEKNYRQKPEMVWGGGRLNALAAMHIKTSYQISSWAFIRKRWHATIFGGKKYDILEAGKLWTIHSSNETKISGMKTRITIDQHVTLQRLSGLIGVLKKSKIIHNWTC